MLVWLVSEGTSVALMSEGLPLRHGSYQISSELARAGALELWNISEFNTVLALQLNYFLLCVWDSSYCVCLRWSHGLVDRNTCLGSCNTENNFNNHLLHSILPIIYASQPSHDRCFSHTHPVNFLRSQELHTSCQERFSGQSKDVSINPKLLQLKNLKPEAPCLKF